MIPAHHDWNTYANIFTTENVDILKKIANYVDFVMTIFESRKSWDVSFGSDVSDAS